MKKALTETQTLRAGCSKAEPKFFAPPHTRFPGAQDGQNLISWRWSLPSPTDPVWWRSIHAISSYRGNSPTNKQTHKPTHKQTGPVTIHCAAKLSAQCNEDTFEFHQYRSCFVLRSDGLVTGFPVLRPDSSHFGPLRCRDRTDGLCIRCSESCNARDPVSDPIHQVC